MSDPVVRFQITLQTNATPDAANRQIRALLKRALRQFGMRCVDIRQLEGSNDDPAAMERVLRARGATDAVVRHKLAGYQRAHGKDTP